jgi:hypothetical protein
MTKIQQVGLNETWLVTQGDEEFLKNWLKWLLKKYSKAQIQETAVLSSGDC